MTEVCGPLLWAGKTHIDTRYPGSASSEVLILSGPLAAVQARVISFYGQPAELCETSAVSRMYPLQALLIPHLVGTCLLPGLFTAIHFWFWFPPTPVFETFQWILVPSA